MLDTKQYIFPEENVNNEKTELFYKYRDKVNKCEQYTNNNLTVKRPGTGISPMEWDEYMGKNAN